MSPLRNRPVWVSASLAAFFSLAMLARTRPVEACGGCFTPPSGSSGSTEQVVTDHRMVLSLSSRQTTLWDQFRYAGSPSEFVWILPVRTMAGAQVGVGDNNFVDAVDRVSTPTVSAEVTCVLPGGTITTMRTRPPTGGGSSGGSSSAGGGGGCGGSSISYTEGTRNPGTGGGTETVTTMGDPTMSGFRASSDVLVSSMEGEAVVGPYAVSVVDPASGGMGLDRWLAVNGLMVPGAVRGAVEYYSAERYGFVAVRLRPGLGVQQMQPVRVTVPGYQPVLPLRFVAAGVADKVGLLLLVLAESRVQTQTFRNAVIDESALVFDWARSSSNYRSHFDALLRAAQPAGVGAWVTEASEPVQAEAMDYLPTEDAGAAMMMNEGMDAAPMPGMMGGGEGAGMDAGAGEDAMPVEMQPVPFVDRRIAFAGFATRRAVLTRLRTSLSTVQLGRDLTLEASIDGPRSREYTAAGSTNTPCAALGGRDYDPVRDARMRSQWVSESGANTGQCSSARVPFGGRALTAWAVGAVAVASAWRRRRRVRDE